MEKTSTVLTPTPQPATDAPRIVEAFRLLEAEINAVPDDELIPINIDIPTAITTAHAAAPKVMALRAQIAADLPKFDLASIDKLELYALALQEARAGYLAASATPEPLDEYVAEATELRDLLLADVELLVRHGLLDGSRLSELSGPVGFKNVASDLATLARMLRDNWSKVSGKIPTDRAQIDKASTLADFILSALAQHEKTPATVRAASLVQQRAFVKFVKAYNQDRRAVAYLRAEAGDVDEIIPSLYAGRSHKNGKDDEDAGGATGATGAAGATGATAASATGATGATGEKKVWGPVGTPTSNPFIS